MGIINELQITRIIFISQFRHLISLSIKFETHIDFAFYEEITFNLIYELCIILHVGHTPNIISNCITSVIIPSGHKRSKMICRIHKLNLGMFNFIVNYYMHIYIFRCILQINIMKIYRYF